MTKLVTERLEMKDFTPEDAPFIKELLNSPLYIKNIGDRQIGSVSDAEKFLVERLIPSYQEHRYGLWAVRLRSNKELIGMCGLVNRPDLPQPDIGFAFLPEFLNRGYGYESAKTVLEYAKTSLGLDTILAITDPDNTASIQLLKKLGLTLDRMIEWGESKETLLLLSTDVKI